MKHRETWAPIVADEIARRTTNELMARFIREGAVGGRVNNCADAITGEQVVHNEAVVEIDHGPAGNVYAARPPARFSKTPVTIAGPAPSLGEHGRDVLAKLALL